MASPVNILLLLLVSLTASAPFSICFAERNRKELWGKHETIKQMANSSIQTRNAISLMRVVQLSWRPRVFLYKGFLTNEECDHLISMAQGMKETSEERVDGSREILEKTQFASSESLPNFNNNLLARIEERISGWTFIPKENGKPLKVMRYGIEEAHQHFDYSGNRTLNSDVHLMATLVLYLSDVTQGGEILFPESESKSNLWSDCTKGSALPRPVKGNAILFFNAHLNASWDARSTHARCPVLEGEMWCATKHFLVRAIGGQEEKSLSESDGSDCTDEDDNCPKWAALGECQRNPIFMTGSPDYYGTCRKSCNAC